MNPNRRVVVTGVGVVAPNGLGREAFTQSLLQGSSGEGPITRFESENYPFKRAFEVKGFNPREEGTHLMDPFIQYAIRGTKEALEDAAFDPSEVDPFRVGIAVSSSKGGMYTIERFKERFHKNPSAILGARIYTNSVPNFAAQWIARRWKLRGPAKCYVAACATGTVAIDQGVKMVKEGVVDFCIAGASDASIVPLMLAGYSQMKALAKSKITPYDKNRQGFLVGEGAGIVFLETLESARARKRKIYAEIKESAYGQETQHPFIFDEKGEALARMLKNLVEKNKTDISEIDYINLHGTGTKHGDAYETSQLKKAFGQKIYKVPTSSTKSMTGHMLGASGAVEVIACLLAMQNGFVPPTIGLENPDPDCDLDYTPNESKRSELHQTITFSQGFGGHIAGLLLQKV